MNILDTIIVQKQKEVAERKAVTSIAQLEKKPFFARPTLSLCHFLSDDTRTGIIAEFKRKSPSKGIINDKADVLSVTGAYATAASGLSVLTDTQFFGGTTADLEAARINQVPIL